MVTRFPVEPVHAVRPGLKLLGDEPHLEVDDTWPAALQRRLERLATDRDGVLVREPGPVREGLDDALRAAWGLLPFPHRGAVVELPHLAAVVDLDRVTARATGEAVPGQAELIGCPANDLLAVGWMLACCDDLVVLRRTGNSQLVAELLAVAFPSGWPVRERAGADLTELHAPVADGERLRRASPALSEALLTKGPYRQWVWGLARSGRLDDDPTAADRDTATPPPEQCWLRVERQTSLPLGDRALYLLRPWLTRLVDLTPEQRVVLASAVRTMSPASRAYKGIDDELAAWLLR